MDPFVVLTGAGTAERRSSAWWLIGMALLLVAAGVWLLAEHWRAVIAWIQQPQGALHRELATAMRTAKDQGGATSLFLIGFSFFYGVFHAVGPGHGKMVIATYLASHPTQLRRGLLISILSSFAQGVTAVTAVGVCVWLLDLSTRDTNAAAADLELTSFVLVAALGAYLSCIAGRRLLRRWQARRDQFKIAGCGHHHYPEPRAPTGLGTTSAMIASIGIRPCSGAILVLLFAFALDLVWGGVLAVLAMSLGTAITVASLAVLTIAARALAQRAATALPGDGGAVGWLGEAVALAGGLVIIVLGVGLIQATLSAQSHPLF